MAIKITRAVDDAGAVTYTEEEQTMLESGIDMVTLPLAVLSNSNEFVNKQTAGIAMLGGFAGGVFVGDKYGESIPVLGQRR